MPIFLRHVRCVIVVSCSLGNRAGHMAGSATRYSHGIVATAYLRAVCPVTRWVELVGSASLLCIGYGTPGMYWIRNAR